MTVLNEETVRHYFVIGLRDAHAVENQALALIDRQLDRVRSYPEVADQLSKHRRETEAQLQRLEGILGSLNESHSALKDAALSLSGNLAALGHSIAGDEILKNTFANYAFENFEAASYRSLIAMAEAGSFRAAVEPLRLSLDEEVAMASWIESNIPTITTKFLSLSAAGEKADR